MRNASPLLLDAHTHVLAPKIAAKVLTQLNAHYTIDPIGTGLADDLLARLDQAGLDGALTHTAATAPAQVVPANNWALELGRAEERLIPFGTLHPGYEKNETELKRLADAGVKGLKFHPEFQGYRMDDASLLPVLEMALNAGMALMFHVGDRLPPAENPSCPMKLLALAERFLPRYPDAVFIAAHLGGYLHWDHALACGLVGSGVYLDTSSSLPFLADEALGEIFSRHPRERILFGSDYPLYDPAQEKTALTARLGLSEADFTVLAGNIARLLGLTA